MKRAFFIGCRTSSGDGRILDGLNVGGGKGWTDSGIEFEDELGIHTGVTHSRTAVGFEREQKGDGSGDSRDADGLDGGSGDSHWRSSWLEVADGLDGGTKDSDSSGIDDIDGGTDNNVGGTDRFGIGVDSGRGSIVRSITTTFNVVFSERGAWRFKASYTR